VSIKAYWPNSEAFKPTLGLTRCSMTADEAISFIKENGVVLASAKGPVPRLTEAIVNGPVKGSW
jgi:hypothetical protein